jgi:hypothetical protein
MTAQYCTYFDHRYLSLGLALHASMRRHCQPFRLWVLCLTEECHAALSKLALPDVVPLRLETLEAHDPELLAAKRDRQTIEYYFTCTPSLIGYVLAQVPEAVVTYLDADLFFLQRPDVVFDGFADHSILIVPHGFSKANAHLVDSSGIYNVGWVSFRRDEAGLACLRWWRERCLESCSRENGQCGDQKYLDDFPRKFARVLISRHPGVNLAPWNLDNRRLSIGADGKPLAEGEPVIFFHFSQLRRITAFLWRAPYGNFGAPMTPLARRALFRPYLAEVVAAEKRAGYHLPPPTLTHGRSFLRRTRWLAAVREILALALRGGGIWVLGGRAF